MASVDGDGVVTGKGLGTATITAETARNDGTTAESTCTVTVTDDPYAVQVLSLIHILATNERVTEFMFVFGAVKAGFGQVETPYIYGTVAKSLSNGTGFVNVADVGGLHDGQWVMGVSRWVTTVYSKTTVTLPKTGY